METRNKLLGTLVMAAVASFICGTANATDITGSIYFNGGFTTNGYAPQDGGVPPGYGNETSNTVTVGPGVEFGFQDVYNRDTADFTGSTLVLEDTVLSVGASPWQQTFVSSTPGYFDGVALESSSFSPDISYSLAGDTLTVDWAGEYETGSADYEATFSLPAEVSAAPEPASWALMIAGVGMIGLTFRQARRRHGFKFANAV